MTAPGTPNTPGTVPVTAAGAPEERRVLTPALWWLVVSTFATSPTLLGVGTVFGLVLLAGLWLMGAFSAWVIVFAPLAGWVVIVLGLALVVTVPTASRPWWVLVDDRGTSVLQTVLTNVKDKRKQPSAYKANSADQSRRARKPAGSGKPATAELSFFASRPRGEGLGTDLGAWVVDRYLARGYVVEATARRRLAERYCEESPLVDVGSTWLGFMRKLRAEPPPR